MNNYNNRNYNGQSPVDPDEIRKIRLQRQSKINNQKRRNNSSSQDTAEMPVIRPQANYQADNQNINYSGYEQKPGNGINIPARSIFSENDNNYSQNMYYNNSSANDISFRKVNRNNYNSYENVNYYPERENANYRSEPNGRNQIPQKKKKNNGGCFSTALIALVLVVAILCAGCYGYIYSLSKKVNHEELNSNITAGLVSDKKVKNILLIGLDKENDGISRSDTMMLLSIDKKNRKLKLTSFLRDMWVEIPGNGSSKLNASFAYGGAQLTIDTLETNFNIDIEHYVLVDFEMFQKIIDSLGGITVDITDNEARFLNSSTRVNAKTGKNKLNGEDALIYARIRKLDSDFYRTQRQRKVISAIISKAKSTNPVELAELLSKIAPLIRTDIESGELTNLAFGALFYIKYDIDQLQVPADGAYASQTISGQAALVPDMDKNINNIHSFIYG